MADKVNKKAAEREKRIQDSLKQLRSKKASDRREAAYWLGEAAAVEEIPELVRVYQTDTDGGVRAAAAYALGQFKAVEGALADGQRDEVEKLLEKVERKGEYGSRGARGRWTRWALGLLLAFAAFVALAWVVYGGPGGLIAALQSVVAPASAAQSAPNLAELDAIHTDLQTAFQPVKADVNSLQAQFTTALAGNAPDCSAFFNKSAAYALPAGLAANYPSLADLGVRLNEMQSSLGQALTAFETACQSGTPLTAATAGQAYAALRPAVAALPEMEAALAALSVLLTPTPTLPPTATGIPTATPVPPTATPVFTPVPTTDIRLTDPRRHLTALYAMVDQMIAPGGQAVTLLGYWTSAAAGNRPAGCGARLPEAPAAFELPDADRASSPELAAAVDEINNGLELVQTGWTNFVFACSANSTGASSAQGQRDAQAAITAFELARQRLDVVSGS